MRKLYIVIPIILIIALIAGLFLIQRFYVKSISIVQKQSVLKINPAVKNHKFDHIIIIMEENRPASSVLGSNDAPYANRLANAYSYADNYFAVSHPSLPNYLAITSGTTAGITDDCSPPGGSCVANVSNIADEIEGAGKTWRAYLEGMPAPCTMGNSGQYVVRHNPFMYYPDIAQNSARCKSNIVPFSQFSSDLGANSLPDFSFIVPNLCNDMHDCSVSVGDNWLAQQVPLMLQSPSFTKHNSLLAIIWDEDDSGANNVAAIFAGASVKRGYVSLARYTHYSLLRTIESLWNLPALTGNDQSAPLMSDMLNY